MLLLGANAFAIKTYRRGTHRTRNPDDTIARIQPLIGTFGITRVANLTGLDRTGLPVVMVCRPNARSSAVFHGKGINLEAAKASGLMEAIETWHAEHVQLPLRFGSFNDLVPTRRLAEVSGLPRLPDRWFNADLPMLWVEGHDLIAGDRVWVPFETVHADSAVPGPPSSEVVKVQYVEHVPPDVAAAKFWLLNRRRAQWSDTSRHELTGANGGEIEIRERSDLDRARRIAYILSQAAVTKAEG
jgi:hypothetical protein